MLEELRSWLEKFTPLEMVDLFITAFEDLRDINELGAETEFALLWQEKDRLYNGDLIDSLHTILLTGCKKCLCNHGVFFNEETTLPQYVKAVEGLIWLNNTEDHEAIVNIFNEDVSDKDKLASLFQYVNNDSLEKWQDALTDVSQLLIERILIDHNETRIITEDRSEYDLSTLTRYDVKFQNRLYRTAVEFGANPGIMDPITLLEMFRDKLSSWAPFSPRDAAIDLVGLVIFSSLDQKNLVKATVELSERFYTDAGFMMALKSQIGQVYGEIQIYG